MVGQTQKPEFLAIYGDFYTIKFKTLKMTANFTSNPAFRVFDKPKNKYPLNDSSLWS